MMTYQQKWLYKKVNIAIQSGKKSFENDLHLLIPPKIWHLGKPDNAL